jgi:hypothetical protein
MYYNGISMIYYGESSKINLDLLEYIGISKNLHYGKNFESLKEKYLALLNECIYINENIINKYKLEC